MGKNPYIEKKSLVESGDKDANQKRMGYEKNFDVVPTSKNRRTFNSRIIQNKKHRL